MNVYADRMTQDEVTALIDDANGIIEDHYGDTAGIVARLHALIGDDDIAGFIVSDLLVGALFTGEEDDTAH